MARDEPEYRLEVGRRGADCRVYKDGELVEGVVGFQVGADLHDVTRLRINKIARPLTITGPFGRVEERRHGELNQALREIAHAFGCRRQVV